MNVVELDRLIDDEIKKRGILKYTVNTIKIHNSNYFINEIGDLKYEQFLWVRAIGYKLSEEKNEIISFKINLHKTNKI